MALFTVNIPENIHITATVNVHIHQPEGEDIKKVLDQLLIIKNQIEMTKAEFIQSITDLKTEVTGIGVKVDALEAAINNAGDSVPQEIQDAFADLKGSVDSLNTKADNTPATPPTV